MRRLRGERTRRWWIPDLTSLPPDFHQRSDVIAALRGHEFGRYLKLVRIELDCTQEQLGLAVGLAQSRVCKLETGQQRMGDLRSIVGLANVLQIPPALLGFTGQRGPAPTSTGEHYPARPSWDCDTCCRPWPCLPARKRLLQEFQGRSGLLHRHLDWLRAEARIMLPRLSGAELYQRFKGWA